MAKGMTKSEFVAAVAEKAALEKKQVTAVLDAIAAIATNELKGARDMVLPGLVKITAVPKPAQPERPGINPFTKAPIIIKAKPASTAVKARPVKALKDALM